MQGKFHQYDLITELAKKHSHATYLASPVNEPEQQVVLIVFSASLFKFPHERENLLQKAQRIKQLQHPHLLPILNMEIEEEQPFVMREYLPNGSLRSLLKQLTPHRLELRDALTMVLQVGEALAYAHEHHIVHGNVKPENILLDANRQAQLTDFSLVNRKDAIIRDQTSGEYAFCYLAPEQFAGVSDVRSDQYALGCLAYELITGQVPFAAQTLASMIGQPNIARPAPLSEKVANLPPTLEAAVLKTLTRDPGERFFDFSLFLEVIHAVLSPPPAFPLFRSPSPREKKTPPHPMQSTKAKIGSPPIRKRAASEPLEPARAFFSTEVDRAEPAVVSLIPDASVPEQTGTISVAEQMEPVSEADVSTLSLSQAVSPLAGRETSSAYSLQQRQEHKVSSVHKRKAIPQSEDFTSESAMMRLLTKMETHDVLSTNLFVEEEADASPVRAPASSGDNQEEGTPSKQTSLPTKRSVTHEPQPPRTGRTRRGRGKLLGLVLLLSVIGVSVAFTAFYPFKITKLDVFPHATQVANVPISETPLLQSSVQATPMAIPQPSVQTPPTVMAQSPEQVVNPPAAQPAVQATKALALPKPSGPTPAPALQPPLTPTVIPVSGTSYEAEGSGVTLAGGAKVGDCGGCSGGKKVYYMGVVTNKGLNGTLQFNTVNKQLTGRYKLTIGYVDGDAGRILSMSINGGSAITIDVPGTNDNDWYRAQSISIIVNLNAGTNTIKFYNSNNPAPDLDRIVV